MILRFINWITGKAAASVVAAGLISTAARGETLMTLDFEDRENILNSVEGHSFEFVGSMEHQASGNRPGFGTFSANQNSETLSVVFPKGAVDPRDFRLRFSYNLEIPDAREGDPVIYILSSTQFYVRVNTDQSVLTVGVRSGHNWLEKGWENSSVTDRDWHHVEIRCDEGVCLVRFDGQDVIDIGLTPDAGKGLDSFVLGGCAWASEPSVSNVQIMLDDFTMESPAPEGGAKSSP